MYVGGVYVSMDNCMDLLAYLGYTTYRWSPRSILAFVQAARVSGCLTRQAQVQVRIGSELIFGA